MPGADGVPDNEVQMRLTMKSGIAHPDGSIAVLPTTRSGRFGAGLALVGFILWTVPAVPFGGRIGLGLALAGGVVALLALLQHGERAVLAFAALIPFLLGVALLVAEIVEVLKSL